MSTPESAMDAEFPYMVEGFVSEKTGLRIVIEETASQNQLKNKGFGEIQDSEFVLQAYEALYLIHTGRLVLSSHKTKSIDFGRLFDIALKHDKDILTKFLIYRDLRSRGYVAKEGFGFGVDFRVYERGEFERKPAKYVIFGVKEGVHMEAEAFSETLDQITKMGKSAVVAVIERRGEIVYYKTSKVRFGCNKIYPTAMAKTSSN
jgi:tRNA-intron endonuclease